MIKFLKQFFSKKVKSSDGPQDIGLNYEIYKGKKNGKWYFRGRAKNGKIVTSSRQGYENRVDCISTIGTIQLGSYHSKIIAVN